MWFNFVTGIGIVHGPTQSRPPGMRTQNGVPGLPDPAKNPLNTRLSMATTYFEGNAGYGHSKNIFLIFEEKKSKIILLTLLPFKKSTSEYNKINVPCMNCYRALYWFLEQN